MCPIWEGSFTEEQLESAEELQWLLQGEECERAAADSVVDWPVPAEDVKSFLEEYRGRLEDGHLRLSTEDARFDLFGHEVRLGALEYTYTHFRLNCAVDYYLAQIEQGHKVIHLEWRGNSNAVVFARRTALDTVQQATAMV